MNSWPRYGVLAAAYAAHVRETAPHIPVVAGVGRVFATQAAQTLAARDTFGVEDLVPLALRRWRKQAGLSQRAAAEVVPLTNEPRWMAERGQSFQSHGPQWTGERRPGQYP